MARPNLVRATLYGVAAALAVAVLIALLVGILDVDVGLLPIAAVGGWAIGTVTRAGAWPTARARPSAAVRAFAIACSVGAWVAGYYGAYLVSLFIRQDSALTFGQRLAQSSFPDWLSPQFGPLHIVELLLFAGIAWYSSRSS